jgi:hypothetical protein
MQRDFSAAEQLSIHDWFLSGADFFAQYKRGVIEAACGTGN